MSRHVQPGPHRRQRAGGDSSLLGQWAGKAALQVLRHGRPAYEKSTEVTRNRESCGPWRILAVTLQGDGDSAPCSGIA